MRTMFPSQKELLVGIWGHVVLKLNFGSSSICSAQPHLGSTPSWSSCWNWIHRWLVRPTTSWLIWRWRLTCSPTISTATKSLRWSPIWTTCATRTTSHAIMKTMPNFHGKASTRPSLPEPLARMNSSKRGPRKLLQSLNSRRSTRLRFFPCLPPRTSTTPTKEPEPPGNMGPLSESLALHMPTWTALCSTKFPAMF